MRSREQITGYAKSGVVRIAAIGSQFVLIGMISRYLGVVSTGQYANTISIASIVAIVVTYGQMAAVIKELPEKVNRNDVNGMSNVIARSFYIVLVCSVVLLLPIIGLSFLGTGTVAGAVLASGLGVGLGLLAVNGAVARSYGAIFISESAKAVIWRLAAIACLGMAALFGVQITINHVLLVVLAVMLLSVVVTVAVLQKKYKLSLINTQGRIRFSDVRVDTLNWFLQSLQTLLLNVDVVLVGALIGLQEAGIYFVLTRMASLVSMPLSVTNPVIQPMLGRIAKTQSVIAGNRSIKVNARANIAAALVISLVMIVFSKFVYNALTGEELTSDMVIVFFLLLFSQLVNCCVGPTSFSTQLFNVRKQALQILLICLLGMVVCIVLFSGSHGIFGVAATVCFWRVLQNAWTFILVWKKGGLNLITGSYRVLV